MRSEKQKNKKKISLVKAFRENYHFAIALFVFIVIFIVLANDACYAAESDVGNGGSYETASDFRAALGIAEGEKPYVNLHNSQSAYELEGKTWNNVRLLATFASNDTSFDQYFGSRYDNSVANGLKVPTSITVQTSTVNFPDNAYYFNGYAWASADSQKFFYNYRASGSGRFATLMATDSNDNDSSQQLCIVSDQPFVVGWTRYMAYFDSIMTVGLTSVDTPMDNGFYVYATPTVVCSITNMPIYLPSSDGESGYQSFKFDTTDFSFDNDNFNFNNLTASGAIVDPGAPDETGDSTGMHYNYAYATVEFDGYTGGIYGNYKFSMNNYMLMHPEEYVFRQEYSFDITQVGGKTTFSQVVDTPAEGILAHNDQQYNVSIPFASFLNNGQSMSTFLAQIYANKAETSPSYYNDDSVISYGVGQPHSGSRSFGKFTLGLRSMFNDIITDMEFKYKCYFVWTGTPESYSGTISGKYNLRTGESEITENTISNNLNPPDEAAQQNYGTGFSNSTGYGNNNNVANANANPTININMDKGLKLDDADYVNLKNMFGDIKDFVDSTSENSFWGVITQVFGYIPAAIWGYITITVAAICAFAVARYVLRR